jgi:hypothetical protein
MSDSLGKKAKAIASKLASPSADPIKVPSTSALKDTVVDSPGAVGTVTNQQTKRSKKAAVKKETESVRKSEDVDRYKDLPGVTEWF